MTETVVRHLLVDGRSADALVPDIARRIAATDPGLPGLAVALPFLLAAGSIDDVLGAGPAAHDAARQAWRAAALIGAEVLALQAAGRGSVADLAALWETGEGLFGQ